MTNLSRRDLHRMLLAVAGSCMLPKFAFSASENSGNLSYVDPELRQFAAQVLKVFESIPALSSENIDTNRQMMEGWRRPPLPSPQWAKKQILGPAGAPPVTLYVINSQAGAKRPAILHTHGGGFVMGKAIDALATLQELAAELDCTIVTVDYRLAPETHYLGSTADNYAALEWLHSNAIELGVDASRIAVMGESAGGGHAALLALKARDIGKIPLVAQILIYPMLDDRTGTLTTPPFPIGTILWTSTKNRFGWKSFLGQEPGGRSVPPQAVPARRKDLAGLPPTFIGVGLIDLFVDEDIAYARALIDAGVETELLVVPGAFHGFDGVGSALKVVRNFNTAKLNALRRAFTVT